MLRFVRPLFFIAVLYVCAVAQASFLPHFAIIGQVPNLVFILFFVVIFFEDRAAFFVTAAAGILLDIFFFPYVGMATATLFGIWALQKVNSHFFKKSYHHRTLTVQFILSFAGAFTLYTLVI